MPNYNWEPRQPVYASLFSGTPSSPSTPPSPPSYPLRPDQYVHVRPPDPSAPLGTFEHPFPYGYVHSEEGKKARKPKAVPPTRRAPRSQAQDPEIRCTGCSCHQAPPPFTAAAAADETSTQQPTDSASSSTNSLTSPPSPPQPAPRRRVRFVVSEDARPSGRSIPSSRHPSRLGFDSPSTDFVKGRVVPPSTTRVVPPSTRVAPTSTTREVPLPTYHHTPTRPTHPSAPQHTPRCILCGSTPAIASASEPSLAFCEDCWDEVERAEVER